MGRTTRVLNISVPPQMYEEIEQVAKEESRTKSELLREAFRQYQFNRRWKVIRQWGEITARRLNIVSDEDIERIAG
ncbi:MAG: ribbon-helix-helix protein, CopG family [Anaerolineae bacterium]